MASNGGENYTVKLLKHLDEAALLKVFHPDICPADRIFSPAWAGWAGACLHLAQTSPGLPHCSLLAGGIGHISLAPVTQILGQALPGHEPRIRRRDLSHL